jgi:Flp pilus assembly protein TadD
VPRTSPPTTAVVPTPKPAVPEPASTAEDFKLALYYQRTGDFEQSLVHYKAVLQRDEMDVNAHNNLGNLYLGKGLLDDAVREFRRVTAIEPRYVSGHVNLAATLYRLKRYDEAAAEARAALALEPRNEDAYVNLALAQAASGQAGDARASLTRALEIDKHNAAAHYNLALEYEQAGEVALALDHYREFLRYAGPEQAAYAADVRARVQALEGKQ